MKKQLTHLAIPIVAMLLIQTFSVIVQTVSAPSNIPENQTSFPQPKPLLLPQSKTMIPNHAATHQKGCPDNIPNDFLIRILQSLTESHPPSIQATIKITGNVTGKSGIPPYFAYVIAMDLNFSLENFTVIDVNGYYELGVHTNREYYLIVFPKSNKYANGYYLHGHVPEGRYIYVRSSPLAEDFKLEEAFDIVLETYDKDGNLFNDTTFTAQHFATDLNDSTALSVFATTDKGSLLGIPCLIAPLNKSRKIFLLHEIPEFGKVMLRADNDGNGYCLPAVDGIVLNVNYEIAKTRYRLLNETYRSYLAQGYTIPQNVSILKAKSEEALSNAAQTSGELKASWSDTSLNYSLWASEALTLGRAQQDILKYRTGSLTVNFTDASGNPVPLVSANLSIKQTSHDFNFGVFDNVNEVGISTYRKLQDIGLNYATCGFYWTISEPQKGAYAWDSLNHSVGVVDLKGIGLRLKAHALCYLLDIAVPDYVKAMNFTELNTTVYEHVNTLAKAYKDHISVWEASNEAHGKWASLGMNRTEMTQIIKTSAKAIRDAVPNAHVTVNSAFDWFCQSRMPYYLFGGDNFSLSNSDYLDYLISHGVSLDGIEQQMYDGGHSEFAGLWSMDVPTFDIFELSMVGDKLSSYGKPVRISEQSVSSKWNDSWKDAGYLHEKWSPSAQAEFVRSFYTLMFSKENFRGINWWDIDDNTSFMAGGGLFDDKLQPKPVFYAMRDLIKNWTTELQVSFNGSKPSTSTAFAGNYTLNLSYVVPGSNMKWLNYSGYHISEEENKEIKITIDTEKIPADLEISEVTVSPTSPVHGDVLTVNASVQNIGPGEKENVTVVFCSNGQQFSTQNVNLSAGQYLELDASCAATYGLQNATVVIDPLQEVNDPDRSNNQRTVWTTVGKPNPDLTISPEDIGIPSGKITEGDKVEVIASIHVTAEFPIDRNITIEFLVDNQSAESKNVRVENQSNINITFNWTAVKEEHTIAIRVDSTDAVAESNETNNTGIKKIYVFARGTVNPPTETTSEFPWLFLGIGIATTVVIIATAIAMFLVMRKRKDEKEENNTELKKPHT